MFLTSRFAAVSVARHQGGTRWPPVDPNASRVAQARQLLPTHAERLRIARLDDTELPQTGDESSYMTGSNLTIDGGYVL